MGAGWLLVALAVSADHGSANVSIQAEARGSTSLQGGALGQPLAELSVRPNLDLGLVSGALRAGIGYHPQFTLTGLTPAFLHRVQANAEWRLSPGRRAQVDQQLSFGQYDTSLGNLDQAEDGLFPVILPLGIVDYLMSDTAVSLDGALTPRLRLRAAAGYHVSGGLTAAARTSLPLQQGPRLTLELQHQATRRDAISGHAKLSADDFSNGKVAGVAEGGVTWRSVLTREWALSLGAGAAAVASAATGQVPAPAAVPVAAAGLTYGVPRLRFSFDAAYAPQADALSGDLFQRAGLSASGEYHPRSDLTARASVSSSFSVAGPSQGDRSVQGEASLAWHEGSLDVSAGLRAANVVLANTPATDLRAFVAFSLKGPVR